MNNYWDNRISFWDLDIRQPHIGTYTYTLLGEPYRGGSCLVYPVLRQERVGEKTYERRVILKEFYPLLDAQDRAEMQRKTDGSIEVSDRVRQTAGYQKGLSDFHESYVRMLELSKFEQSAELLVVPLLIVEDNGTWYREEAYDAGISFSKIFDRESYDFGVFMTAMGKCYQAIQRLHQVGYYHLDVKPQNIAYTHRGEIKLFDADSFIKKEELKNSRIMYWSDGYSAPEIIEAVRTPEDTAYLIGPWTDVYSLAQIICWYLYGQPLAANEVETAMDKLYERVSARSSALREQLSRKGIYRLRMFLLKSLNRHRKMRYPSIQSAYADFRMILSYLYYDHRGEPYDNFKECDEIVWGYDDELVQLEEALLGFAEDDNTSCVASLVSESAQERELIARYYATINRLEYSDIVEVHCNDFSEIKNLIEYKGKKRCGDQEHLLERIQCPFMKRMLFLIFDNKEADDISKEEIQDINILMGIDRSAVLMIGKKNRCLDMNGKPVVGINAEVPTIAL